MEYISTGTNLEVSVPGFIHDGVETIKLDEGFIMMHWITITDETALLSELQLSENENEKASAWFSQTLFIVGAG